MGGYLKVTLRSDEGGRKTVSVHRLVAICFIENPAGLPEVNHKDGVKINCRYDNLEWVTHAGNVQHAWDTGLVKDTEGRRRSWAANGRRKGATNGKARAVLCLTTGEEFDCMASAMSK